MALVISKHIEIKTGLSIRKFKDECKKIVDGEIFNHLTQKKVTVKAEPPTQIKDIISRLGTPH